MSDRTTDAASRTGTGTAPHAPTPRVPAWRRRLYRVPLLGAIVYLIWPIRTKRPSLPRRILSWVAVVVVVLGLGMVGYPTFGEDYPAFYRTSVERLIEWSNFVSDMQTNQIQTRLEEEFRTMEDPSQAGDGDPLTRLEIPKLGVDTIVVAGTSQEALRAGAGHYPQTPLPGQVGNVTIAGHRTTYGRPFSRVDELAPGDEIVLSSPAGTFTYRVAKDPWVTGPHDWSVADPSSEALLTLTTCHPRGSDRQRLIVRAELAEGGAAGQTAASPQGRRPLEAGAVPAGTAGGLGDVGGLQAMAAGAAVLAIVAIGLAPPGRRSGSRTR